MWDIQLEENNKICIYTRYYVNDLMAPAAHQQTATITVCLFFLKDRFSWRVHGSCYSTSSQQFLGFRLVAMTLSSMTFNFRSFFCANVPIIRQKILLVLIVEIVSMRIFKCSSISCYECKFLWHLMRLGVYVFERGYIDSGLQWKWLSHRSMLFGWPSTDWMELTVC